MAVHGVGGEVLDELPTALLIFLAAAAGTGVVAADFGRGQERLGDRGSGRQVRLWPGGAIGPEGAVRADSSLRIIDAFLVRAADDVIGRDGLAHLVALQKLRDFGGGGGMIPQVAFGAEPLLDGGGFAVAGVREHGDHQFRGARVVGAVGGDGSDRAG